MYTYFITKAIYYPSYHYFVVTHALWHMMYGYHCGDNREGTMFL